MQEGSLVLCTSLYRRQECHFCLWKGEGKIAQPQCYERIWGKQQQQQQQQSNLSSACCGNWNVQGGCDNLVAKVAGCVQARQLPQTGKEETALLPRRLRTLLWFYEHLVRNLVGAQEEGINMHQWKFANRNGQGRWEILPCYFMGHWRTKELPDLIFFGGNEL